MERRRRTIRELRDEKRESQSDLARAIGCSGPQVAAWESGTAPLPAHRRAALARHFGVKPDDIEAPLSQRDRAEAEIARLRGEVEELRARLAELEEERGRRSRRKGDGAPS
jgi:transcriptional regulator with XRE-family HTH domain